MRQLISFVIPCYHSEKTVGQVVDDIFSVVKDDGRYDAEVVLINDNPPDATWDTILDICAKHPNAHGYCMTHNFGQHAALIAGYGQTTSDIIVSLDDDGQTPPSEAFKLIDALGGSVDLVYASYPQNAYASLFRKLGSMANDKMAEMLIGKPKGIYLSSYLATTRDVIDRVLSYKGPYPYVDGLMLQCCTSVVPVPVEHRSRQSGESGYSLGKLLGLWLNGFTSFSVKPLRIAILMGTILAIVGFMAGLFVFIQKLVLQDDIDAGWSSIVCLLMLIGGMIMMMIGMVGEYVGRIFMSINNAPQYYIRQSTDDALRLRRNEHRGGKRKSNREESR